MAKTIQFTEDDRKKYSILTNILGLEDLDVVKEEYNYPQKLDHVLSDINAGK